MLNPPILRSRSLAAIPLAILFLAVAFGRGGVARADRLPADAVEEFKTALKQEKDGFRGEKDSAKEAMKFRRANLTRKAAALRSLGEMSRVLLLDGWRADAVDEGLADVDRDVRDAIADRFTQGVKDVVAQNDPARRAAVANLLGETASAARASSSRNRYLRLKLASLAPELVKLTSDPAEDVQSAAALALGNVQGDAKITIQTLEKLLTTGSPTTRRAAAEALGSVVNVVALQVKKGSGSTTGNINGNEERIELLTTGLALAPVVGKGLAADQRVEVRRLCIDALQQVTMSLVDLVAEPVKAEEVPPVGRPWTADEARQVERAREGLAGAREEMKPIFEEMVKLQPILAKASNDRDDAVRIQARRVYEDLAFARLKFQRWEASIPRGEGVPAPVPDDKPIEKAPPKANGGGLPLPPESIVPIAYVVLVDAPKPAAPKPVDAKADTVGDGLKQSLGAIIAGLSDTNVRARLASIDILEIMAADAAPAIPALVEKLQDNNRFVRWGAVRTLGRLAPREPDRVVPAVAQLLSEEDLDLKITAAATLEKYGPEAKAAVPTLTSLVDKGDADARISTMKALEAIGTAAAPALPAIALNLEAKNSRVRTYAAESLGRFGALSAKLEPALRKAMTDTDAEVRRAASEAVLKLGR